MDSVWQGMVVGNWRKRVARHMSKQIHVEKAGLMQIQKRKSMHI
jgi:hypothetical protein